MLERFEDRKLRSVALIIINLSNLQIAVVLEGLLSETPYLIHDTTKAPHITGSGVLLVVYCLCYIIGMKNVVM